VAQAKRQLAREQQYGKDCFVALLLAMTFKTNTGKLSLGLCHQLKASR